MSTRLDNRPMAAHLTPEQIERLRRLLVDDHADRQARAAELQDPVGLEPDLAAVLLTRSHEAMDEIDAALARIGRGSYGMCTGCGGPIPFERLEMVPAADRCVACQAVRNRASR